MKILMEGKVTGLRERIPRYRATPQREDIGKDDLPLELVATVFIRDKGEESSSLYLPADGLQIGDKVLITVEKA